MTNPTDIVPSPYHVFEIQIPGFVPVVFKIPRGLSEQDWEFLMSTQNLYFERYRQVEREKKGVGE